VIYDYRGHAVLVDMGTYRSYDSIKAALYKAGIIAFDHVIISHWHGDHTGCNYTGTYSTGYDHWKRDFDFTNTIFWVPNVPESYGGAEPNYFGASFQNSTINRVTTNGLAFTWNNIKFSIYNASSADFAYYDENASSDYNVYSFITYAEFGQVRICNTADINNVACERAVEQGYTFKSDVMTVPHHGTNQMDDSVFSNAVKPLYAYVPNNNFATSSAYRDGIFKDILNYATIFANVDNADRGVSFFFNKNGIVPSGNPTVVSIYGTENTKKIYVDPSVSSTDIQDGSEDHPYKYLRRAISDSENYTSIYLLGDTSETVAVSEANGVINIYGNNHSSGFLNILHGSNVNVENLSFPGAGVNSCIAYFKQCTLTDTVIIKDALVTFDTPTITTNKTAIKAFRSVVVVLAPTTTVATTDANGLIYAEHSFLSGAYALGSITGARPRIRAINSYADFGRLVEGVGTGSWCWNTSNPPLVLYDRDAKKYYRLLTDGTAQYVQNEKDALKCKQVSISLPSSVSVPANTATSLLTNFDITAVESDVTQVFGFSFDWTNGTSAVAVDKGISQGKLLNLKVISHSAITATGVRLTLWYK